MKLNKFSMMLAAAALVGCSDDFSERFADQAIDDARLIQLDPNFTLAGIGDEGNATRTHWTASLTNMFLPIYNATGPVAGHLLSQDVDLEKQAVGLCWMGQTEGSQVYTNYEFYHFGWLNAGVTGVPEYDKCSGNLTNGASYDDITITTTPTGTAENEAPTTDFVLPTWSTALNYNSGIYKTNNKAIFGGRYVVYYPYNPNFKDAGTIPVVYNTEVTRSATVDAPELGQATFRYSAPTTITGGAQAAGFNLKNLSTLVQLRIASAADKTWGDGGVRDETIDKIVLYSKKEQLLKQVNLCADKIAAGKTGTELYDDEKISAKKIVIDCGSGYALEKTSKNGAASTYITLLPTTVEDLQVLVHNSTSGHESWARYTVGNRTFEAGKADQVKIDLAKSNFNSDYIAVDDATLQAAITEIASATATIEVIGDITVSNRTIPANVTITGDKLIVPENVTLTVNGTVESEIEVYGKTCCSTATAGGRLVVGNVDAGNPAEVNKVTLFKTEAETPTDDLNPAITYTASQYSVVNDMNLINAGNVYVEGTVAHKGNFTTAGEAKVTVANTGDLNFMGATVVNNGTIEVKKAGQFDMTDENGDATADDGKNMTNNGIFIHNVDAAVGTAVQAMNQNGEYRCRVDEQKKLDDAYLQWTACNVIEIVEKSSPQNEDYNLKNACQHQHKGNNVYVDIVVNNNASKFVRFYDDLVADGLNINIGNLTVNSELRVNYSAKDAATDTPKRTLTVNGDMNVNAVAKLVSSAEVRIKGNLTVSGASASMVYNAGNGKLTVDENVTVDAALFTADKYALNISCANFYLKNNASATFGNRKDGTDKNMTVSGEISNPAGCTFTLTAATGSDLLAWITCKTLKSGGSFPGGKPKVVN